MIVHLLRHAKTEASSSSGRDYDRKLASKGYLQCAKLKEVVKLAINEGCKIHCSSAQRTRETGISIFETQQSISYHDELYLCDRISMAEFIRSYKQENEILIIGHNFGISDLASYFLGTDVTMKTSGFISMEFPNLQSHEISGSTGILISSHRCNL